MDKLDLKNNLENIDIYSPEELLKIQKAYEIADFYHDGQKRQSGEDYIIHPLMVAYILSEHKADADTICAGLLHDTLEDTNLTKEEIKTIFNEDVANLVEGVTKISKLNFNNKLEEEATNTKKLITAMQSDIRILIIKLADRLHNMRTLQYKKKEKQIENAMETMEIFAPLANYLGMYKIKCELEDISFSYLKPLEYNYLKKQVFLKREIGKEILDKMKTEIHNELKYYGLINEISDKPKNICGVYRKYSQTQSVNSIRDILTLKIIVESEEDCYEALNIIHYMYNCKNEDKDYIKNPKTNFYRSLHTTLILDNGLYVQLRIRTKEMDNIDTNGVAAYWNLKGDNARVKMQSIIQNSQFMKSIKIINSLEKSSVNFLNLLKQEILQNIYVFDTDNIPYQIPTGSSIADLIVCRIGFDIFDKIEIVKINDEEQNYSYKLKTGDKFEIILSEKNINNYSNYCDFNTRQARLLYLKKLNNL